jgi:hypothetical protein
MPEEIQVRRPGAIERAMLEREQWEEFVKQQLAAVRGAGVPEDAIRQAVPAPDPRHWQGIRVANPYLIGGAAAPVRMEEEDWMEPDEPDVAPVIEKKAKVKEMFKYRLSDMLGWGRPLDGMYGLEVEVEGQNLPREIKGFRTEHDGSLRGEENMEYIFERPMSLREAEAAVKLFGKTFKKEDVVVDMSYRTSVHVHVNVSSLNKQQICTFLYLAYLVETALVNFCGPTRIGNRFCLRLIDAQDKIAELEQFFQVGGVHVYDANKGKYSAINLAPMRTQGSVEFRSMKGTVDKDEIINWLNIINRVYEAALGFKGPEEVATFYLSEGPKALAQRVFGEYYDKLEYDSLEDDIRMNFSLLIGLPFEEIKDFV